LEAIRESRVSSMISFPLIFPVSLIEEMGNEGRSADSGKWWVNLYEIPSLNLNEATMGI
jgi:hypothetical protein